MLELLVTMGVVGTLVALILPAVQMARESARCLQCESQLKQVGLGLAMYCDTHDRFPAAWRYCSDGHSTLGWATSLLPWLEQQALYADLRQAPCVDSPLLARARSTRLPVLICPSDIVLDSFPLFEETHGHEAGGIESDVVLTRLPAGNYIGVFGSLDPDANPDNSGDGVFIGGRNLGMRDIQRGLSSTMLVGERTASKLPSTWLGFLPGGEDAPARVVGFASRGPNRDDADECEFSSRHANRANFLWADGHVAPVSSSVDSDVYRTSARRY